MSNSGSRSDSELDPDFELALCIVLERSKVDNGGSYRVDAARMPELDPPGPRSAPVGQRSLHRPRVVPSPRCPLLRAGSGGC